MEVFTYLKNVNNIETLNKLVSNIESYTPTLLKYIALRTLNLTSKRDKVSKSNLKEVEKIVEVVEEQTNKAKGKEWLPSEVVSVMSLFSSTQSQIKGETREFIECKLRVFNNYNMYDIVQVLNTVNKIKVKVDKNELREHIEKNIEPLLKEASITNIYSMLNVLSINGIKLGEKTIWKIMENIEGRDEELSFKELTNMYNSTCRQVKICNEGGELEKNRKNCESIANKIQKVMERMYSKVLQHVQEGSDDFEGIVDVLDGIINTINDCNINSRTHKISKNNNTTLTVDFNELISGHYKCDEMLNRCSVLIERLKHHFSTSLDPKLVRILVRNISVMGYYDEELMKMIISHYKSNSRRWSLQGNIDLLNSITLFKMGNNDVFCREFQIEEWMECISKYDQIINENHVNQMFINVAMYNSGNGEDIIDSLVKTGLVGESELYIGIMIRKLNDQHTLKKLSLKALELLNKIKIEVKPQNTIRCDDPKDVGKIVNKLKFINGKNNLNFVNFCNFNIV